jgi:hypothetical protein
MTFRVRRMTASGDMTFGHNGNDFLADIPEAVGQVAFTRVKMWEGQWFLNLNDGTPFFQEILGKGTQNFNQPTEQSFINSRDAAIQSRLTGTPFLTGLPGYNSNYDSATRAWQVNTTLSTAFGQIAVTIPIPNPSGPFTAGQDPAGGGAPLG